VTIVNESNEPVEKLIALQSAAFFHEHPALAFPFEAESFTSVDPKVEAERRLRYFAGDWIGRPSAKGGKKK
jgi:hypothetical protein